MMSSRLLKAGGEASGRQTSRFAAFVDRTFESLHRRYRKRLHNSLDYLPVTVVFALVILSSIYFLYSAAKSELAPQEDQGVIIAPSSPAANATLQRILRLSVQRKSNLAA